MGGAGGGGKEGKGDGGGWVLEKAHGLAGWLAGRLAGWPAGCLAGWLAAKGAKRRFLGPKTAFWLQKRFLAPKMHFGAKKQKTGSKNAKKEKMELKTPKKPLSRATFAQGCENDPKRCPKTQKMTLPSKQVSALKITFSRQNEKMSEKVQKG